ncbi:MAG: hypothetical protein HGA53_04310 [Anaerolineaceae bacterium]|nr:hypothetical protein [Anaerolineaceae bacterium]
MNRSLINRKNSLIFIGVLALLYSLISIFYVKGLTSNYDDLSVLRASAYLNAFPGDPLVANLNGHLEKYKTELGSKVYGRYLGRLTNTSTYFLQNQLVVLIERFPIISPYGSVLLSGLIQHYITIFILVLVLFSSPSIDHRFGFFALLISVLPTALFPSEVQFTKFFPFQMQYVWFTPVSRGASLTAILAVFILLEFGREIPRKKFYPLLVTAGLVSLLTHFGTFVLFFIPLSVIFIAQKIGFYRIDTILKRMKPVGLLILFNCGIVLVAITFLVFFNLFFQADFTTWTIWKSPLYWAVSTNLIIIFWAAIQRFKSKLINSLFSYFFPLSLITIAVNLFHSTSYDLRWSNLYSYYLLEGAERLTGFVHLLFWIIVTGMVFIILENQKRLFKITLGIGLVVVIFVGNIFWTFQVWQNRAPLRSPYLLDVKASDVLLKSIHAYDDEVVYFQSIANELRERNIGH